MEGGGLSLPAPCESTPMRANEDARWKSISTSRKSVFATDDKRKTGALNAAYPTQAQKQGLNGAPHVCCRCSAYLSSRYRGWTEPQVIRHFHFFGWPEGQ